MRSSDSGYSVLRLVTDPLSGASIPVGAVAWDANRQWYDIRVIEPSEGVHGVDARRRRIVLWVGEQLRGWASERRVPYEREQIEPWDSRFWRSAADVLTSSILLDEPRPMEPLRAEDQLEALYEALVKPAEPHRRSRRKIQGALSAALGPLAARVRPGVALKAFASHEERVMRGFVGLEGVVIVEAVNLAGRTGRRDADALVSRIWRILAGQADRTVQTVVGYRASPGGLNGEADMKAWMEHQLEGRVYDLNLERDGLQTAIWQALRTVGADEELFS